MKNFDLTSLGVHEMNTLEMQETDGGIFCAILIIAAVCLLSSCQSQVNINIGDGNSNYQPSQVADSTMNGNDVRVR